jgi:MSHA pilin protein MshC
MSRRSHAGFTLVELVTVIVVLGITMAVVGPRFVTTTTFQARGYANELAGALRYAQRIAFASSCNVRFTVTSTTYVAAQRASPSQCATHGAWNREVLLPDGNELTGTAPADVSVSAAVLEFDGSGRPVGTPPTFTVGSFTLTVDALTARVTIQ